MAINARITDIRVALSVPTNRKIKALRRALGPGACWALLELWIYCAANEQDGALIGWTAEDVEAVANWDGNGGQFVEQAVRIGLLDDLAGGGYEVHDWAENQPWVASAPLRSSNAKRAVSARWDRVKAESDTPRIRPVFEPNTDSNTPLPFPSTTNSTSSSKSCRTGKPALDTYAPAFEELWALQPAYRRKGKGAAWKAYCKVNPGLDLRAKMASALREQVAAYAASGKGWEYWPLLATWINQARWDDESAMPPATPSAIQTVIPPHPSSGPGSQPIKPLKDVPEDDRPTLGLRAVIEQVRSGHG